MNHLPVSNDPQLQKKNERFAKQNRRIESFFRRLLRMMELAIAAITVLALLIALGVELYRILPMSTTCCTTCWPLWWVWNLCEC